MIEKISKDRINRLNEILNDISRINKRCISHEKAIKKLLSNDCKLAEEFIVDYALNLEREVLNNIRSWYLPKTIYDEVSHYDEESMRKINAIWNVKVEIVDDIIKVTMPTVDRLTKKKDLEYVNSTLSHLIKKQMDLIDFTEVDRELLNQKEVSILYLFSYKNTLSCGDYDNKEVKLIQDILSNYFFYSDSMAHINTFFSSKISNENLLEVYITSKKNQFKILEYMA